MIYILYLIPIILGIYYIANGIRHIGVSRFLAPLILGPISLVVILWRIFGEFENDGAKMLLFVIAVVLSSSFMFTSMVPTEKVFSAQSENQKVD
ncbi:hypothetical protein IMZ31_05115 [Pontibacillus sp. ALD_SL1]|uniref:hypothetical protein n=1 Tax=Pontibacillus sp. ALD_SL1 TaxID=2777185 RepID=UPI001A961FEA|nr:hypothetical protein [Pontibacillus sp. ALD_SL1]QST00953.1 hypothetical protein IMZ31_05115 [Pontibacillus sp. ALD_SL1]